MVYSFSIYAKDTQDIHLQGYFIADERKGISACLATKGVAVEESELFNICLKIWNREDVATDLHYIVLEVASKTLLTYKKNVALKEATFFQSALENLD